MIKKYMLISVHDREILTEPFNTKEEAQDTMHKEMIELGDVPEDIFEDREYDNGSYGFGEYGAYANNGTNFDWLIVAL